MKQICENLEKQYQEFDDLVSGLTEKQWRDKTPFFGWTIFDQVAHVAFFDHEALLSIESPGKFLERAKGIMSVIMSGKSWRTYTNPLLGPDDPSELLNLWRDIRSRLLSRLIRMSPEDRVVWYGPEMSVRSFATARFMETWAHSQDVLDSLSIKRVNGTELFHIAHIGVTTFDWSFIIRKLEAPGIKPRIELTGPSGELWNWGEPDAVERVWGSAKDFCLVVTQRRNVLDTGFKWKGKNVAKWLTIAQSFAGVSQQVPAPGVRLVDYKGKKKQGNRS
jgi:uncharacterized protein (TIGR03084 family)